MTNSRSITPLPAVDFTPELGNYKTLQPFRYWCQKVLPLVYDDSLSYYELLCKVIDYLNKTMEDVETLHGDVTNLHTAYEQLQNYVNTYFSTLDVQEEINNKLNQMASDGTLSTLIAPFIYANANPIFVDSVASMTDNNKIYVLSTNGHIFTYNGSSFSDTGYVYSLDDNIMTGYVTQVTTSDILSNADNAIPNRIYSIATPDVVANLPSGSTTGTLICMNYIAQNKGSYVQMFFASNGSVFSRIKWGASGGTWSKWYPILDSANYLYNVRSIGSITTSSSMLANADDAEVNRVYVINDANSTIANLPDGENTGCLLVFNYNNEKRSGTTQLFISTNNSVYNRIRWGATPGKFGKWNRISNEYSVLGFATQVTTSDILSNADNAIPNRIYSIATPDVVANLPSGSTTGTLICMNYIAQNKGSYVQMFFASNGSVFSRIKWGASGGTWSKWYPILDSANYLYNVRSIGSITTSSSMLANADDAEVNRVYVINDANSTIANLPDGENTGCLLVFNYNNEKRSGTTQLFISTNNSVYNRIRWGATPGKFGKWNCISNPNLPKITPSMFEKWGAIGDSFMSGVCGNYGQYIGLSWVQNMARKNGVSCTNYSTGGLTTRTWLTNSNGLAKLNNDEPKNLYIIALGINDSNPDGRNVPLGTINDLSASSKPDTFYGNMGAIHDAIIAKNHSAIVCYITIPRSGDRYEPYSEAIVNISKHYNALLIDSRNIKLFKTKWWNSNLVSEHPTAPMYSAMSEVYEEALSNAMFKQTDVVNQYVGALK